MAPSRRITRQSSRSQPLHDNHESDDIPDTFPESRDQSPTTNANGRKHGQAVVRTSDRAEASRTRTHPLASGEADQKAVKNPFDRRAIEEIEGVADMIIDLRNIVRDLQDFIVEERLFTKLSEQIRSRMSGQPGYTDFVLRAIVTEAEVIHDAFRKEVREGSQFVKDSITFSACTLPYIKELRTLAMMASQWTDANALWENTYTLHNLALKSTGGAEVKRGFGERTSDRPCDELMMALVLQRDVVEPGWNWQQLLRWITWERPDQYGGGVWWADLLFPETRTMLNERKASMAMSDKSYGPGAK